MNIKEDNNFTNVSALIDERFGEKGTESRSAAEEMAYALYINQISE